MITGADEPRGGGSQFFVLFTRQTRPMQNVQQWRVTPSGIDRRPGGYEEPNSLDVVAECGSLDGI